MRHIDNDNDSNAVFTKAKPPGPWKQLRRHPLSGEYHDLAGRPWEQFVENLKQHGVVGGRKVTLYEGKVIDGWQLQRACVEANVRPKYQQLRLRGGMTPEEYVETVNDLRRHETQEQVMQRVEARRQRVAEARAAGQSTRGIAEAEGVSQKTVLEDLKRSGDGGSSPATVTGQDGKTYPSRAERVGQKPPESFVLPSERMAGGDSEQIERDGKADRKARAQDGKPVFDDVAIAEAVRKLAVLFNDRAQTLKQQKSQGWSDVRQAMEGLIAAWDSWRGKQ
jgi:hypothetical protein